jgi:hypothetical protein
VLYSKNRQMMGIRSRLDPRLTMIRKFFYFESRKIITKDVLNQLDSLGLAVWYCDDGTYHWQTHSCKIYSSFSYQECLLIQRYFKNKWNIRSKIWTDSRNYSYLKLDAEETRKFLKIIKAVFLQYQIPKCMWYKLGHLYKGNKTKIDLVLERKRQDNRRLYQKLETKQQKRNYYLKNREKILKQRKDYNKKPGIRKKRKIYMREYNKKYREKNRDRINQYKREWRRKRKEIRGVSILAVP